LLGLTFARWALKVARPVASRTRDDTSFEAYSPITASTVIGLGVYAILPAWESSPVNATTTIIIVAYAAIVLMLAVVGLAIWYSGRM
jgi:hypothetical protein